MNIKLLLVIAIATTAIAAVRGEISTDDLSVKRLQDNLSLVENAKSFNNLLRINDILDLFNIEKIGSMWRTIGNELTKNCSIGIADYLDGLQSEKVWAIKMDDATGHYTAGFFYGNNYWMGSLTLCSSIFSNDIESASKNEEKLHMKKAGLSFSSTYNNNEIKPAQFENPPFVPGFYVLKVWINETIIAPAPRTIFVGLCLPSTCSNDDVLKMTRLSQSANYSSPPTFIEVRSPTQRHYDVWSDTTFIILLVFSSIVAGLIICGTSYDLILIRRDEMKISMKKINKDLASDSSSGIGCTTYDLTNATPNKKDLSIGLPRGINNNNSDENLAIESVNNEDDEELSVFSELLLSFSLITNFKAICDSSVGSDTIPCIHGLRAISMAWVILGHTCIIVFKYSDNMELRKVVEKSFWFQTISNGAFSVDTFFVISGFLVSFIYFRTNAKGKLEKLTKGVNEFTAGTFHFFGLVGYRFVRLTAPYLFVLGAVEVLMKYFEQYSVFEPPTLDHVNCPKYWWRNVLYINTLFPVQEMCMLWSWYLANDTQFYIIGAVILIIAVRHFKIAASILSVFMLSSWVTTGFIAFSNNHMPNTDDPLALFDMIYDKPWTRIGPYMIGMSVGWILFKTNCKIRMNKLTVSICWGLSTTIGLYLIFGLFNTELTKLGGAAYSSLSHSAWALSIAWIIVACSTGYGSYINTFLSAPFIYPFSRATYCAYLVHPIVIRIMALNSTSPLHLGTDSMMIYFFGQVVCSYVLAFIVSFSFEAPVVTMLKILSPNRKKRV